MILGIVSGLVPLRLFLLVSSLVVGCSLTVAFHNLGLRSLCVYSLRLLCRWLLLVSGHFYIPIMGNNSHHKNNEKDDVFGRGNCPKIIVSNHVSNMEILHLLTLPFQDDSGNPVLPVFVTKESIFGLPFIGTITRDVLGSIGVARKKEQKESSDAERSPSCTEQILSRVRGDATGGASGGKNNSNNNKSSISYGPIVIFPEGTTTNGTCLLVFKKGAFVPLVPVRPVLYSFGENASDPRRSPFLPTYESIWGPVYLWRLLCQPVHQFQCRFLDPITPTVTNACSGSTNASASTRQTDPSSLFAETVRSDMALKGNLPMLSPDYNYQHKLEYHGWLRKAFVSHHRGPIYAMCFAPMQKVYPRNGEEDDERIAGTAFTGYDVVVGTKFAAEGDDIHDDYGSSDYSNSRQKKDT
jgi:1-acyl-sn-glycerol-3-phosphate acyltransferase